MSQYIKKLQAGGTFSTPMGDYDENEVLRAFNQTVLDDLNKLGHIRKKKWPEYEDAYRDIVNGIQNGTLTIDAAGIVSGQIGDSEPYKFMVSSLNKAIQGLTAKEAVKTELKTEKVKYDASDNGMEAFNQYFFQGELPLGKKESLETLNKWYLNLSDELRNLNISKYLQFRAESLDPNLDYDLYGGYEKVKNGILAAKDVFYSTLSTDNDRWLALNSIGLVKLANIGQNKPKEMSEEEMAYKAWLASNPSYMMFNDNDRRQAFELAKDKLRKLIFESDTDTNNQNNGDQWMLDFVNTNWVPKSLYPSEVIYTHQFDNPSYSNYHNDKSIGKVNRNDYVNLMIKAYNGLIRLLHKNDYDINYINQYMSSNGRLITHYLHDLINNNAIESGAIPDNNGGYLLKDTVNINNGTIIRFDPNRNEYSFVHVDKNTQSKLYEYMLGELRKYGAQIGRITPNAYTSINKHGGIVKALIGINTNSFDNNKLRDNKSTLSSNTKVNDQRQYDHMHQPESDSTFKKNSIDRARMAGMWLDILGIGTSFAPVYGTSASLGFGLGSTAANLYADIKDPNVGAWSTLGNAVSGVGLDLVGSIPGVGLSKLGRISKNLVRIAPMLSTIPAVKELMDSDTSFAKTWSKIGTDESFNMEDLKNIQSALLLALAATSGTMSNMRLNGAKRALKKNNIGYNLNDKYSVKTKQTKNGATTNVELDLTENQYNTLKNTEKKEDRNKLLQEWFGSDDLNIEMDKSFSSNGAFNHIRSNSYDFDRISGPNNTLTNVARYKRWQKREGLNGGSWFEPKLKENPQIIPSDRFGGSLDYIRTLRNFTGDNAKSSIVLSKHEKGGILKADNGLALTNYSGHNAYFADPWDTYNNWHAQNIVLPWYRTSHGIQNDAWESTIKDALDQWDAAGGFDYLKMTDEERKKLWGGDETQRLQLYIIDNLNGLNDEIAKHKDKYVISDTATSSDHFDNGLHTGRNGLKTDIYFGIQTANRRPTIHTRSNDEMKRQWMDYFKGLGYKGYYVYKDHLVPTMDESNRHENEADYMSYTSFSQPSSQPTEAPQSNQPTQPTESTTTTASTATSTQTQSTDTGAKVKETPEEKKLLEGMYALISSLTRPQREYDWNKLLSNLHNAYPNAIALGRLADNIYTAKGLERLSLKNRPALEGYYYEHMYDLDDLHGVMAANAQANLIASQMGQPRTSDASINNASMLEGLLKAGLLNYEAQLKSNDLERQTKRLAKEIRDRNNKDNLRVRNFNLAALIEDANYKNKVRQATKSNIHTNIGTYSEEQELRAREKNAERKANQLYLDEKYLAQLAAQEAASDSEYIKLKDDLEKAYSEGGGGTRALVILLRMRDIQSRYSDRLWRERYRLYGLEPPKTSYAKRGGRIDDSDIKKRQKDHDRLVKEVLHTITHHLKALDNLSKGQLLSIKKLLS